MSRTKRTSSPCYYGNRGPVLNHLRDQHLEPESEHYRERWYHGYDGGRRGIIRPARRAGDMVHLCYGDRGCSRSAKRLEKRRASKLTRLVARENLRDLDEWY